MSNKSLPLKPGVGQNISLHVSPTVRDFFLELITDPVRRRPGRPFTCCFQNPSRVFPVTVLAKKESLVLAVANVDSCVGSQSKIGHPARRSR